MPASPTLEHAHTATRLTSHHIAQVGLHLSADPYVDLSPGAGQAAMTRCLMLAPSIEVSVSAMAV